jgi:hypothetical protein
MMDLSALLCVLLLAGCGDSSLPGGGADLGVDLGALEDLSHPPIDATIPCVGDGACPGALTCCAKVCVDTQTDPAHCSQCGMACSPLHAVPSCVAGACKISMCVVNFEDCDGNYADGCEIYTQSDKLNCGSCGHVCPTGMKCTGGACGN